jgi:hypothetical protein
LQIGEPQTDERRDANRCWVAPDLAARGCDLGEPENQSIEYAQLLGNALMALRKPLIEIATVICMKHRTPPETNICSLLKQCLCQDGSSVLDTVFLCSSYHFAIPITHTMCYTLSHESRAVIIR